MIVIFFIFPYYLVKIGDMIVFLHFPI